MGAGSKVLTFLIQMEGDIFPSNPNHTRLTYHLRTINMNQIPLMSIYLEKNRIIIINKVIRFIPS